MPLPKEPASDLSSRVSTIEGQISGLVTSLEGHASHTEAAIQKQADALAAHASKTNDLVREMSAQSSAGNRELSESLRKIASETNASIQALSLRQEQSHRAPWSTLAAWAGVVLAIGGVFGSIVMGRIVNVEARVDAQSSKALTDAYDFGRRDTELKHVQSEIERLRGVGKAP
jgi:DNA-binding FrmR family transcriptional regulator